MEPMDRLVETRAYLDGVVAMLEQAEGTLQIDPFSLRQMLRPVEEGLDQALKQESAQAGGAAVPPRPSVLAS